ncbi:hypothetical protein PsorP6_001897 [Peronosclerospora sorghi]|uniref:Uncharacterized protein n=1 Tax=Peronosclerospora sorghi TaxID=230839 RepID=A0ACC0WY90_9STRA|nr:hypothetical protein PsorP6_001897 [Peronosclerospora sorghi]
MALRSLDVRHTQRLSPSLQATGILCNFSSNTNMSPIKTMQSFAYAQMHKNSIIINFGLGQPSASLLPLNMFRSAAMARFSENQVPVMLQYGSAKVFIGFRHEIAKFVADTFPINATHPDTFMVTAGNSQAISHAAMTFSKTKKLVFVEEPTYFLAHDIFRELGLEFEGIYAVKDDIDLDSLEERLMRGDVPAFLYTIPFLHNPTGAVLSSDRCKRLVGLAQNYGFHIISDEPYNLLHMNGSALPPLASYDDSGLAVSLGIFSEILVPGLRLGWAQSSEKTIEELSTIGVFRSGGGQNPVTAALVHISKPKHAAFSSFLLHVERLLSKQCWSKTY